MMLAAVMCPLASGQLFGTPGGSDAGSSTVRSPIFNDEPLFSAGANNFLADSDSAWIRHIGGGGPGWQPFTAVGGSIPICADNGALLIDAQGLITNEGNGGGSVAATRRIIVGENILGAGIRRLSRDCRSH